MKKRDLQGDFLGWWRLLADEPEPTPEYHFVREIVGEGPGIRQRIKDANLQDWRFDFAWPNKKVAIELDGGIWTRGAHVRGSHYESDRKKCNTAQLHGWIVLVFTSGMLDKDPIGCIEIIQTALRRK